MKKQTSHIDLSRQKRDFKAVEFMRKRRDELSDLYATNPTAFWKQLEEVRKKYKNKFRQKEKHTA